MKTLLIAIATLACGSAAAQTFPSKPIRMLAVFTAGSSGDFSGRLVASGMSAQLGQPVIVENLAGASGVLAAQRVVQSAPDGYTLLYSHSGVVVSVFHLSKVKPFDPVKDFTPIGKASNSLTYLVTHPSLPPNSLKEFIDYAKANPGKVPYGSAGIGSPTHLTAEIFTHGAGIDLLHIPYKSATLALQDIIGGTLASGFIISPNMASVSKAGKVKVLAALGANRSPRLPDVPAVTELFASYEPPPSWTGVLGPAQMPAPLATRLHAALGATMQSQDVRSKLAETDTVPATSVSPTEFAAEIRRQSVMVGEVVKRARIPVSD